MDAHLANVDKNNRNKMQYIVVENQNSRHLAILIGSTPKFNGFFP